MLLKCIYFFFLGKRKYLSSSERCIADGCIDILVYRNQVNQKYLNVFVHIKLFAMEKNN